MILPILFLVPFLSVEEPPRAAPVSLQKSLERGWNDFESGAARTWHGTKKSTGEFFGYGDEEQQRFACSDRNFFVADYEHQTTGERHMALKGLLHAPSGNFAWRFNFMGAEGAQAFGVLAVGQPVTPQYRAAPSAPGPLKVEHAFTLPQGVRHLRVRVEGLTPQPYEFGCDLMPPPAPPRQE